MDVHISLDSYFGSLGKQKGSWLLRTSAFFVLYPGSAFMRLVVLHSYPFTTIGDGGHHGCRLELILDVGFC